MRHLTLQPTVSVASACVHLEPVSLEAGRCAPPQVRAHVLISRATTRVRVLFHHPDVFENHYAS